MSLVKGTKGGEAAGAGTPPAGTPATPPADAAAAAAAAAAGNPGASESDRFKAQNAQRPDYVPEKFWKDGKVDLETAFKSYGELETKFTTKTEELLKQLDAERRKGLPEAPDKYEVKLGEDAPVKTEDLEAHPALGWWRETAFAAGLSPEKFNEGVEQLVGILTQGPDLEAEAKKLGENATARIDAVSKWAQTTFTDPEEFAAVQMVATSAAGIKVFEKLMGTKAAPLGDDPAPQPPKITLDELRAMQADPRYYDPARRDPAFVAKIDEGFALIFGGKKK